MRTLVLVGELSNHNGVDNEPVIEFEGHDGRGRRYKPSTIAEVLAPHLKEEGYPGHRMVMTIEFCDFGGADHGG